MDKITFENLPSTNTPVNASNLNLLQSNIQDQFDVIRSKNLYDKELRPLKNGLWINSSTSPATIGANSTGWYVIVPIVGGKVYTISRKNLGRLYATTTANYPANGVSVVDSWTGNSNIRVLTIQTSANANYLFIGVITGSPTDTEKAQAIEELQVELGTTATSYVPYKDNSINDSITSVTSGDERCIKLIDGTMIIAGKIVMTLTSTEANTDITFSQAFIATPIVVVSLSDVGHNKTSFTSAVGCNPTSATKAEIAIKSISGYQSDTNVNVHYIAIGRWK